MNSSFSTELPSLQLAWDSTSLGALKECPRKYQLSIIQGWVPRATSVHLTFGLHFHAALERYDHAKCDGKSHDEAQRIAVRYAMEATWDQKIGRPWISDDPNKNRFTLVRSVSWYLEQFADDPLETIVLANGRPAVELSFRMETSIQTRSVDERFMLCGHLDRLALFNGEPFIVDRKTTKTTISQDFFSKFSPDNQFSTYATGTKVVYALPVKGLIVDAAQVAVTFTRFQRGIVNRSESQLEEWYKDLHWWLMQAEAYATQEYWPMNDKSCGNYGGCPYRDICSKSPSTRDEWLRAKYDKRIWDPLQVRGDI